MNRRSGILALHGTGRPEREGGRWGRGYLARCEMGQGREEGTVLQKTESAQAGGTWAPARVRLAFELRLEPDFRIYTNK